MDWKDEDAKSRTSDEFWLQDAQSNSSVQEENASQHTANSVYLHDQVPSVATTSDLTLQTSQSTAHLLPDSDTRSISEGESPHQHSNSFLGARRFFLRSPERMTNSADSNASSPRNSLSPSPRSDRKSDRRLSASHVAQLASMLRSPVNPNKDGSRRSGGALDQLPVASPLGILNSPRTPDLFDDSLSAIRAGLDQALGTDGNGSWLAHSNENTGYFDALQTPLIQAGDRIIDADQLSLAIPTRTHTNDNPTRSRFPTLHLDTSGPGHRRHVSLTSAEAGLSPGQDKTNEPFNWSSVIKNVSYRVTNNGEDDDKKSIMDEYSESSGKETDSGAQSPIQIARTISEPTAPTPLLTNLPPGDQNQQYQPSDPFVDSYPLDPSNSRPQLLRRNQEINEQLKDEDTGFLTGKSLGIFDADNDLRVKLHRILLKPWVDPLIFTLILLQTVILSLKNSTNVFGSYSNLEATTPVISRWGKSWTDWGILAIFAAYTAEICAKIIVYGLLEDAESTIRQRLRSFWSGLLGAKTHSIDGLGLSGVDTDNEGKPDIILSKERGAPILVNSFSAFVGSIRLPVAHNRAFLRSSWNRVDFAAVVSFWVSFILDMTPVEKKEAILVFRAVSCIRVLRLLNLTAGTASVLRALKKAAPLLNNVVIFIGFFW